MASRMAAPRLASGKVTGVVSVGVVVGVGVVVTGSVVVTDGVVVIGGVVVGVVVVVVPHASRTSIIINSRNPIICVLRIMQTYLSYIELMPLLLYSWCDKAFYNYSKRSIPFSSFTHRL